MANQNINKVIYGDQTLIDLTSDTVTPATLLSGVTAHDKSGELIVGTATGGSGGNKIIKNQTLTFTNLVATVSDTDISANSDFAVYYYDLSAAEAAGITAVSGSGVITFTAQTTPQSAIVVDIVLFDVGGGGSAEVIEMTQAEYDALPNTKLTDGVLRAIKDTYIPSAEVTTKCIYSGRESEYHTDESNIPIEFDVRTFGDDFSTYLSTNDYKTFTVIKNFMALVTYGIEQDPNRTSSNKPNCTFFINDSKLFRVETPSDTSGSNVVLVGETILFAGDTFFWGSDNTSGYAVRLGQIDILEGFDLDGYTKPTF